MKRVLLITKETPHKAFYCKGLERHFRVECVESPTDASGDADAIIYDLAGSRPDADLDWLARQSVPVIVLTPDERFGVPPAPSRRVLVYPVTVQNLLDALAELGVSG